MSLWDHSSDEDEAQYADLRWRGSIPARNPSRKPTGPARRDELRTPEMQPIFRMGTFTAGEEDNVVSLGTPSPHPDPKDVSFSLSKPEATRRAIEKCAGSDNAYTIARRGSRPHTPYRSETAVGKPLDSDTCQVRRASRGFNVPVNASSRSRSRSLSLSQNHPDSGRSDRVQFMSGSPTMNVIAMPPSMQTISDGNAVGVRRVTVQGRIEMLALRGRNRSLLSNDINEAPLQYGDDLETSEF